MSSKTRGKRRRGPARSSKLDLGLTKKPQRGRQVNVKFLLIFAASLVVLAAGVRVLHAVQLRRNAGILKSQAQRAVEENHLDEASNYYRRYLKYAPNDAEAQLAWAQTLEKKSTKSPRDLREVIDLYERVLRSSAGSENNPVRRKLVDAAMALGRYSDAQQQIKILIDDLTRKGEKDGELEQLNAFCYAAKGENDDAIKFYERAKKHAPAHIASYVQLAELYDRIGKQEEKKSADKVMLELVKANDASFEAHLARARHLRLRGDVDGMAKETERAFALAKDKPDTLLGMVELAQMRHQPETARMYLEQGLKRYPNNGAMYMMLASVDMGAKDTVKAILVLRQGLAAAPARERNALRRMLAICLIDHGDTKQARAVIEEMMQAHAQQTVIDELNARLLISNAQWAEAVAILTKVLPLVERSPQMAGQIDLLLGHCYDRLGEPDRSLPAYREALTKNPRLASAREGVAGAMLALGRAGEALSEYEQVVLENPAAGAKMARLLIAKNLRLDKNKRNWDEVDRLLKGATKALADGTETTLVQVEALLAQKKTAEALAFLERKCKEQQAKTEMWTMWVDLLDVMDEGEKALAALTQAEQKFGDQVELRLARGRHWERYLKTGDQAKAALRKLEEGASIFDKNDEIKLLRGLGDVHYRAGNLPDARRLWRLVSGQRPGDLPIRLALMEVATRENDRAAIQELNEQIKVLDAEGIIWRYTRAGTILVDMKKSGDKSRINEARRLLMEVMSRRDSWGAVYRSLAALDELEGNSHHALENYEKALEAGDRTPYALRRTIELLRDQQRFTDALQVLKKADERGGIPPELGKTLAALRSREGDHETAIAMARQAVSDGSKDPRDYVWLGQMLWAAGDEKHLKEAEKYLQEAIRLPGADKLSEPWVVLVQFLARTERKKEAETLLEEARRKLPEDLRTLALAQCYEAIGKLDRAEAEFVAALKKNPTDLIVLRNIASFHLRHAQLAKAEPYLRTLVDPAAKATEVDRAWARRNLALGLVDRGNYQQYRAAVDLLEKNIEDGGGTLDDQRTLAALQAMHPRMRQEAIRGLEGLQARQPPTLEQLLILGRLYEAVRDWPKARSTFNILASNSLSAAEPKFDYVARSVRTLLNHGEIADAKSWLQRLMERDPDSVQTLDLQVRLLIAQNNLTEARAFIKKYIERKDANLDAAAHWYEAADQPALAEECYRKWLGQTTEPIRQVALAGLVGRQGRSDEALDLCEQAAKKAPEFASGTAMAVLRDCKNISAAQFQRTQALLDASIKKNPDAIVSRLHSAELREMQGQYADAENAYRQIVEQRGENIVALNNLAWLLAVGSDKNGGKLAEAMGLVNRAIVQAGELGALLDTRAMIFIKLEDTKQAIADLEKALSDEENASRYFHLAQAQFATNRSAAVASMRKARQLHLTRRKIHPLEYKSYDYLLEALDEK